MDKKVISQIYKNNFGFPNQINWGHALFLSSVSTLTVYLIQQMFITSGYLFTTTSLAGFFLTNSLLTVLALLLPVATLFIETKTHPKNRIVDSIGDYTGLGPLLLALISGCALPLIKIPLHNLCAWIWLRMGNTVIFPTFFCVNDGVSILEKTLYYFTNTLIPAFGISFFFTGLLWACLPKDKKSKILKYFIIAFSFAVFSLNPTDFLGLFIVGIWLCFLREKANNAWAPLLALLCSGGMEFFVLRHVPSVDITMVQVYSDMNSTYVYSSAPALLAGVILLLSFIKPLTDFNSAYYSEYGYDQQEDKSISFKSGINLGLIVAVIIFIVLWVLLLKGGNE
ncbi:MAG: CPBP family glutamic-type intramembrane protease [Clostridia bacterium]|nr:CPBP family glutamic-type intramembrane protease [Clostridia bacterium]